MNFSNEVRPATMNEEMQLKNELPSTSRMNNESLDAGGVGCCGALLIMFSVLIMILTFPFCLAVAIKVVTQYERAVILRLGKLKSREPAGPGVFAVLPCTDTFHKVDLRTCSYDVPSQQMLTSDSVTVHVDAVMFYRIRDPILSVIRVEDVKTSTYLISQTTLRNIVGCCSLAELLSSRESIAEKARRTMDEATDDWGISIQRLEIKDVRLPSDLQRAMAAEAEATRNAKAKIILAEGEKTAAESLRSAAEVISQSPSAMQLKYLQTLGNITDERSSTIVFPLPIDFLRDLMKK